MKYIYTEKSKGFLLIETLLMIIIQCLNSYTYKQIIVNSLKMLKLNGVFKLAADMDVPKLGHVLLFLHKKVPFLVCLLRIWLKLTSFNINTVDIIKRLDMYFSFCVWIEFHKSVIDLSHLAVADESERYKRGLCFHLARNR